MKCKLCGHIMVPGDDPDTLLCQNNDCPVLAVHPSCEEDEPTQQQLDNMSDEECVD